MQEKSWEEASIQLEEEARRACNLGLERPHPIAVDKLAFVPACVACPGDG